MTDEPKKYPRPEGTEKDALNDAAWDLRDCGEAYIHDQEDLEKWLYWLRRHEGFAEGEIRAVPVKSFTKNPGIYITLSD